MWKQNLLLGSLSLAGIVGLAAFLLPQNRLPQPSEHDADWLEHAEASEVLDQVNQAFGDYWEDEEVEVAPRADDLTIARRLSLALTGTIPSLEELRQFEQQDEAERIGWWISHLLEDQRYADYVAERMARAFVGTDEGPFLVFRRRRFVSWLSDRVGENMPYDEIVTRLVSDQGLWTDSPPVNFISATSDANDDSQPDPIRLAARTSRAFLGMRIDCLQCHDDNLGTIQLGYLAAPADGTQQDFHQLAAFFGDVVTSPQGVQEAQEAQDYLYTYLDEPDEEIVTESVPFRPDLLPESGTRRERLAGWLTHQENPAFGRAAVNRTWALLFGRPLVEPIDDIPLHAKLPPAMELLAEDFVKHGYDLERLIRIIALSDAYQRDSMADFEITDHHEQTWAVFRPTRLRPEQVAGSIIQASSLSTIDSTSSILTRLARFDEESSFVERYGDRGEDEFVEQTGTIPQQLLLMNGNLVASRNKGNGLVLNAISQLAILAPDAEATVNTAYLTVLTRYPSERELEYFSKRFVGQSNQAKTREMEDLFWVLLKSPDFVWNR